MSKECRTCQRGCFFVGWFQFFQIGKEEGLLFLWWEEKNSSLNSNPDDKPIPLLGQTTSAVLCQPGFQSLCWQPLSNTQRRRRVWETVLDDRARDPPFCPLKGCSFLYFQGQQHKKPCLFDRKKNEKFRCNATILSFKKTDYTVKVILFYSQ